MNFSFSGCGFLGVYHIGVAAALKEYAPDLVVRKIAGASGGAIAACALICDLCLGQACSDVLKAAIMARQSALGPLHPSFNLTNVIRDGLNHFLPEDAHKLSSGRLYISLTRMSDGCNVLVNEFKSRSDLIDALLCSAFIPFYSGTVPPTYQGVHYIDGGWSDNLPVLDEHTVTVSPFSGEADVCPSDPESGSFMLFDLKNTTVRFTSENIYRIGVALFPPHPEVMSDMCRQGFEDTLRFLSRHNLISCTRCIAIRSSIILAEGSTLDDASSTDTSSRGSVAALRVLPKSFTDTHRGANVVSDCQKCQETAARASKRGLPEAVRKSLADASKRQSSVFSVVFDSRPFTMLRYLMLPCMLPVELFFSYFKKMSDRFPSLYDAAKEIVGFLLRHVELNESSKSWKVICEMMVKEMNFSNLSSEVTDTFRLFESPAVVSSQPSSANTLVTTELNFGFAVNMKEEESETVQHVSSMMQLDSSGHASVQACDVSRMVDDLEWDGFRQATNRVQTENSDSYNDAATFDTLGAILDYSRKHDALMAFYYLDEHKRMKMTEIYGIRQNSASSNCGKHVDRESEETEASATPDGASTKCAYDDAQLTLAQVTNCRSCKQHKRGLLPRKYRRPKSSTLTVSGTVHSSSESDGTDELFVPGVRSRPLSTECASYEGGSSNLSE